MYMAEKLEVKKFSSDIISLPAVCWSDKNLANTVETVKLRNINIFIHA